MSMQIYIYVYTSYLHNYIYIHVNTTNNKYHHPFGFYVVSTIGVLLNDQQQKVCWTIYHITEDQLISVLTTKMMQQQHWNMINE